jgi:hypothetical protein
MPSRQQVLKQRGQRAGVYAFRYPPGFRDEKPRFEWDVIVESEGPLGPRGLGLTKRQAIQFCARIASSPSPNLKITFG